MKLPTTLVILTIFFGGCEKPVTVQTDLPICIQNKIADLEKEQVRNPRASIWQYQYNGQTVYYVPPYCCDMYGTVYNSNCEAICAPDGGITGQGDGQCADFFSKAKNKKLIWEDNR